MLRRFLRQRVAPFSPFYRKLAAEHHIDFREIRTPDDLQLLPFTSKSMLTEPREFVLTPDPEVLRKQGKSILLALTHGPSRARDILEDELRPIFMTGTTGRSAAPIPFLYTAHDLANLAESGRRLMTLCRADRPLRHINAFPFAPHLAFWQAHYASIGHGTFMLSTGGGKTIGTEGNIRTISKINPNSIISMPTFLYHLLQQAKEEGCRWTNLTHLVLGGEKVPRGMRTKLADLCARIGSPHVAIMSTYGFTEAKLAFSECYNPPGQPSHGFHTYPDMGFVEIIDPHTGQRVPDRHPGEIVYTPLDARGTVVLRYRTGDLIEGGITREPCPYCGSTCPRLIGKISRVSDIRRLNIGKLKGTLVDFNALENLLDDTDGLGAWQIELRKRNDDPLESDTVTVHAVPLDGTSPDTLHERIAERFHQATEFSPNAIDFHTWPEMRLMQGVGKELKEQKVIDHRPTES